MLFNSCKWKLNKYSWKSNSYYAFGLYVKHRSRYMPGPITINQYVCQVEDEFAKIAKKT